MAKFAPIAPITIAAELKSLGILGDYNLLLAHEILNDPEGYAFVYANLGGTIIVDNGIVELGESLEPRLLLEACRIVNATHLTLPDTLCKFAETKRASTEAALELNALLSEDSALRFLGVCQGETLEDVRSIAKILWTLPRVTMLALPRVHVKQFKSRLTTLHYVPSVAPIHLMGFSEDVLDDMLAARSSRVTGIDSAVPLRLGFEDTEVLLQAQNYGSRGDWMTRRVVPGMPLPPQLIANLNKVRKWLS